MTTVTRLTISSLDRIPEVLNKTVAFLCQGSVVGQSGRLNGGSFKGLSAYPAFLGP